MNGDSVLTLPGQTQSREVQPVVQKSGVRLAEARRRFPINLLSNLTWVVVSVLVSMWYTPFLISHLGVAVYGLVPLVTSFIVYMAILTTGLDGAIGRYLTIDLARGDVDGANRTFNTALVGSAIVVGVLVPAVLVASWFSPQLFRVSVGSERDVQLLVLLTGVSFLITAFTGSLAVPSYAYHRFDLRLLVNVIRLGVQTGSVVLLFIVLGPQLWQVGVGILVSGLLFLLGHAALWRKLAPELEIRFSRFDASLLKRMLGFSGWVLVNMVGAELFLRTDLIVANRIFGPEIAGRYGSVTTFPTHLRAVVSTVNGILMPITMALCAQGSLSRLVRFSRLSVRFMGLVMALPVGLLCGLGRPLLTVWLGPGFADLSWLLAVLVGHLCISLAVVPLASVQLATSRVRTPGIVSLLMGCGNVLLAIALALWSGWGYVGIAAAGAIMLTLKNGFFTPIYSARILGLPWWTFLPDVGAGILGTLAVGAGTYLISLDWVLTSWVRLGLVAMATAVVYMGAIFLLGLSTDDRSLLRREIEGRMKRV